MTSTDRAWTGAALCLAEEAQEKGERLRCSCGRFVSWGADNGTPYGCSQYEPYPEPHDPEFFCPICAAVEKAKALTRLQNAAARGDEKTSLYWWQIPRWFGQAMKETGWTREEHDLIRGDSS